MTNQVSDPIENNVSRVLVRQTATGFEQGIAAAAGFFTAGPLGALASWGTIRGLQGKWAPWAILGFIGAPVCVGVQLVGLGVVGGALEGLEPQGSPQAVVEAPSSSSTYTQNTQAPSITPPALQDSKPAHLLSQGECLFPDNETGQNDVLVPCSVFDGSSQGEYVVTVGSLSTVVQLWDDGTADFTQGNHTWSGVTTEYENNAIRVTDSDGYTFVF